MGPQATWGRRNLFRPSDPIGGAVFYRYNLSTEDNGDVDCAWPPAMGTRLLPGPAFTTARQLLEEP